MQLAVYDGGVDHRTTVVHPVPVPDRYLAGLGIYLRNTDVRPEREGEVGRLEDEVLVQARLHSLREVRPQVSRRSYLLDRYIVIRRSGHIELSALELKVILCRF